MRIAIDATPLMKPHRSGIGRYLTSLIEALAEQPGEDEYILCYRLSRWKRRAYRLAPPGPRFRSKWVLREVRSAKVDVTHGPDGRYFPGRHAGVVTVHDVFSLLSDDFAREKFRRKKRRRYAEIAERADRVVFVSDWTRDRFLEHHPMDAHRYAVIPEGVGAQFRPGAVERADQVKAELGIEGPYALFVGMLSRRKNITGMLDAWEGLPADAPGLVLAGPKGREHEDIETDLARRGLGGRVTWTGYLTDDRLPPLIAGAECLLLPSFLEGFGLPALEAMACGTPLVSSDAGALRETTGGIRVGVDPEDPDSIREGVVKVFDDGNLRQILREQGLAHAARFRWSEVADRTRGAYHQALNHRRAVSP